jgi:hypothetical protein
MIGFAPGWWVAAAGAVLSGAGFTLLYPSLAMITISRATRVTPASMSYCSESRNSV